AIGAYTSDIDDGKSGDPHEYQECSQKHSRFHIPSWSKPDQCHVGFIHGDAFRERPDPVLMGPRVNLVDLDYSASRSAIPVVRKDVVSRLHDRVVPPSTLGVVPL